MRNLKRVLALALALVMILGMMVIGSSAASYSDAAAIDAKYNEAVEVLSGMGVFQGNGAGFAPKAILSRAEASALIYRVLTGDVTDAQKVNYNYSSFDDVAAGEWYTGYVTYAANGGYIKGDGTGNFNPYDTVTGVQVMAIMLRAIGYGQNGEYEGAAWMDNILTDAKELGITGNIATSTLIAPASREVVAQLIFNAINNVDMVTYAPALGYIAADFTSTNWRGAMTLGEKIFGLESAYGVVVGNQATDELTTRITFATANGYSYDYDASNKFGVNTGLDMFGHAVKVWYNKRTLSDVTATVTYALFDKAVKVATTTGYTYGDADDAGFEIPYLTNYPADLELPVADVAMSDSYARFANTLSANYPYYILVSNTGYVDVVIGLDVTVNRIVARDTTSKYPYLVMESNGTNTQIDMRNVAANSVTALDSKVFVTKVNATYEYGYPTYTLEAVSDTKVGTVVEYNAQTKKVVLSDGTVIEKSPLSPDFVLTSKLSVPGTWKNVKYAITLDKEGKYIGAREVSDASFIYGTYADFASAGTNTGTVNYYLTGVTLDGQIVTSNITKYLGQNPMQSYNALNVVKKDWANNNIDYIGREHTGYTISSTGALVESNMSKLAAGEWAITAGNVKAGYVVNAAKDLFMTGATKFIVVSGTGTDTLKVNTYNGIAELLGTASQVDFVGDNMYYVTSDYIYNHVDGVTKQINTVILSADDLMYTYESNLYYAKYQYKTGLSSTANVGGDVIEVKQFELYKDGVPSYIYLDNASLTWDRFYTLTLIGETVSGQPLYHAEQNSSGCVWGDYFYVGATNNLDTAKIYNNLYNVTNAKVVNLTTWNVDTILELNEAVSVGYRIEVDCIPGNNGSMALIYVTRVYEPNP